MLVSACNHPLLLQLHSYSHASCTAVCSHQSHAAYASFAPLILSLDTPHSIVPLYSSILLLLLQSSSCCCFSCCRSLTTNTDIIVAAAPPPAAYHFWSSYYVNHSNLPVQMKQIILVINVATKMSNTSCPDLVYLPK